MPSIGPYSTAVAEATFLHLMQLHCMMVRLDQVYMHDTVKELLFASQQYWNIPSLIRALLQDTTRIATAHC